MGRMKEVYMQIMQANHGEVPEGITIADVAKMKELEIFNWEQYEREQEKIRLFRIKQENPREIVKVAQTKEYWDEQYKAAKKNSKQ